MKLPMRQVGNGKEVREEIAFCPENVPFLHLDSSVSCSNNCFSILIPKTSLWYVNRTLEQGPRRPPPLTHPVCFIGWRTLLRSINTVSQPSVSWSVQRGADIYLNYLTMSNWRLIVMVNVKVLREIQKHWCEKLKLKCLKLLTSNSRGLVELTQSIWMALVGVTS